jgi:hypothetical protein
MAAYFVVNDTTQFSGPELHHSTGRHPGLVEDHLGGAQGSRSSHEFHGMVVPTHSSLTQRAQML